MKKLFIIFFLAFNVAHAVEQDTIDLVCTEVMKYYNQKKNYSDFEKEFEPSNIAETDLKNSIHLYTFFNKIPDLIKEDKDPMQECKKNRSFHITITRTLDLNEVKLKKMATGIFNIKPPSIPSLQIDTTPSVPHCEGKKGPVQEECKEDALPLRVLGLPFTYQYLANLDKWRSTIIYPPRFSDDDCGCLEKKMRENKPSDEDMAKAENKLKDMVLKASGQKLINKYAANYEDVSFYLNNKADVFSPTGKSGTDNINYEFLCNDPDAFKKSLAKDCEDKNIKPAEMEGRLNTILGSLGHNLKGKTIDDKFRIIGKDISVYKTDPKNVLKGNPAVFNRVNFDEMRNGLSQSEADVPFVDHVTTALVQDSKLAKIINNSVDEGKAPYLAILDILGSQEHKEQVQSIFEKIIDKHPKLDSLIKENSVSGDYSGVVQVALNLHPGLKSLLNDPVLFSEMQIKAKGKDSILRAMEEDKTSLSKHFKENCERIHEDLAETVCTPDDDILKLTTKKDLAHLMNKETIPPELKDIFDLRVCRTNTTVLKGSALQNLVLTDPYGFSDFYDRKMNPQSKQNNAFSKAYEKMTAPDSNELRGYVTKVTRRYSPSRVVAPMGFERDDSGKMVKRDLEPSEHDLNFGSTKSTHSVTSTKEFKASELNQNSSSVIPKVIPHVNDQTTTPRFNPVFSPQSSASPQPVTTQNTSVAKPVTETPARQQITEILNPKGDKPQIEAHLKSISNKDADELVDLRRKIASDQETINQLKLDSEKKKTEDLQRRYEELEKKYVSKFGTPPSESMMDSNFTENTTAKSNSIGGTQSSAGKISSVDRKTAATRAVPEEKENSDLVEPRNVKKDQGQVVVESPVGSSEDELYSFLVKENPSDQEIEKLKKDGVTYRYEVIKDGKVVIEEMKVSFEKLGPKVREFLERKLLKEVKRTYSAQALRYELLSQSWKRPLRVNQVK